MLCRTLGEGMDQGQLQAALQDKARLQATVQKLQVQVKLCTTPRFFFIGPLRSACFLKACTLAKHSHNGVCAPLW